MDYRLTLCHVYGGRCPCRSDISRDEALPIERHRDLRRSYKNDALLAVPILQRCHGILQRKAACAQQHSEMEQQVGAFAQ